MAILKYEMLYDAHIELLIINKQMKKKYRFAEALKCIRYSRNYQVNLNLLSSTSGKDFRSIYFSLKVP